MGNVSYSDGLGGSLLPGEGPGVLDVVGAIALGSATTSPSGPATAFEVEAAGTGDGQYSEYSVDSGSSLDLNGEELASVVCLNGYVPADGDTLTIVALWNSTSSVTGNFTDASGNPLADGATIPAVNASGIPLGSFTLHYNASSVTLVLGNAQQTPTLALSVTSETYTGLPDPASATVNGQTSLEGVPVTVAYYSGFLTQTQIATATPLSGAPANAGDYTAEANFAGSTDWSPASSAPADFTISQATLTVTANPASRTYGASDPAYSDTITGFV